MGLKKIIGTNALSYPELRNFAGHTFTDITFKKVIDLYKIPSFLLFRLKKKINRKWQNTFLDLGLNHCDFFHFFNVIHAGRKPYITTYETYLPRWNDTPDGFNKGLASLAKDNCKKIIALSESASKRQEAIIMKYRPDLFDTIMKKNMVLLPPQVPFISNFEAKRETGKTIIFTMVGADFFRKGGLGVLNAFDKLLGDNKPVVLNIVSTMNYGDYASKTTADDLENAMQIIKKYPSAIHLYRQLENEKVKMLLLDTDVALLPSLAETFGYFILEAQAAACPVISTDIRAMPEINNESKGWLISIKSEQKDEANLSKPEILNRIIADQLVNIIDSIIVNPSVISEKGKQALESIKTNHSPDKHKQALLDIYNEI